MKKKLLNIALLCSLIFTSCGPDNSDYIDCGNFDNLVRETIHKNKVKSIIGIDVLTYDYENENYKEVNDTSSITRYDELGNEIQKKTRYYDGRFHSNHEYEYDRYGRKKYSILTAPSDDWPTFERLYFYDDKTTCEHSYSLGYKNYEIEDSISMEYSNDTVFFKNYKLNSFNKWSLHKIEKKIYDKNPKVFRKNIQSGLEKEYEFSSDNKLLSLVTKSSSFGEPYTYKHEFSYNENGLMTESKYYTLSEDFKLISTTKYHYKFY